MESVGNKFICYHDGVRRIKATVDTFKETGTVGLWTTADSVTYFDVVRMVAK